MKVLMKRKASSPAEGRLKNKLKQYEKTADRSGQPLFFKVEVRSLWEHRQMFSNKVRKIGNLGAAVSAFAVLIILDAAKRARKHT